MKESKSTLITIVVLLALFAPLAVYGTAMNIIGSKSDLELQSEENINKDFWLNGKLYFYDPNGGSLKGTYDCLTNECGDVSTIIDDEEYGIAYYKEGENNKFHIVNEQFALFQDGSKIIIYSYQLKRNIIEFAQLKNYGTTLKNNVIIAKQGEKWGLLSLDTFQTVISYEYDFLGLIDDRDENNVLNTDKFIGLKNNEWYLLGYDGIVVSAGISDVITTYNEKYIATIHGYLYDYEGNRQLTNLNLKKVDIIDNYVIVVNTNNEISVYEDVNALAIGSYFVGDYTELSFKLSEEKAISVYKDGAMVTTIALS